jgi:hypothetical protein
MNPMSSGKVPTVTALIDSGPTPILPTSWGGRGTKPPRLDTGPNGFILHDVKERLAIGRDSTVLCVLSRRHYNAFYNRIQDGCPIGSGLGRELINAQPKTDRSKLDEGEVVGCELVIAGGNTPALLDLIEEPLDQVVR